MNENQNSREEETQQPRPSLLELGVALDFGGFVRPGCSCNTSPTNSQGANGGSYRSQSQGQDQNQGWGPQAPHDPFKMTPPPYPSLF